MDVGAADVSIGDADVSIGDAAVSIGDAAVWLGALAGDGSDEQAATAPTARTARTPATLPRVAANLLLVPTNLPSALVRAHYRRERRSFT